MEVSGKFRTKAKAIAKQLGIVDSEFWLSVRDKRISKNVWIAKPEEKIMPFPILVLMDTIALGYEVAYCPPIDELIEKDLKYVVYNFPVDDTDRMFYRISIADGRVNFYRMIGVHTSSEGDEMMKNLKTNVRIST